MSGQGATLKAMGLTDRDYMRPPYWRPGRTATGSLSDTPTTPEPPVRDPEHHLRWKRTRREARAFRALNWFAAVGVACSLMLTVAQLWPTDTTWGHLADWIGMHLP